jgi:hypothetical protein
MLSQAVWSPRAKPARGSRCDVVDRTMLRVGQQEAHTKAPRRRARTRRRDLSQRTGQGGVVAGDSKKDEARRVASNIAKLPDRKRGELISLPPAADASGEAPRF